MEESVLQNKLKLWQNRLLDLSKRNRMISFKDSSAQVIRFIDPDFETIYKRIVEQGKSVQIKRPIDASSDPTVYAVMRLMHHMSHSINVGRGEIRTTGSLEQSIRTIRNIKKYADLSLQEKGTNILYLSFGFIYWRDRDMRGDWYKAPLFLVPASLVQDNINHPFQVKKTEEDMIVNPTFAYYMEANYGVKLPEMGTSFSYQDFHIYIGRVNNIVEKLGWRVEEEVYLSTMSFLKTNMYNDLVDNEQRILSHPIIRCFGGEYSDEVMLDEDSLEISHDKTKVEDIFEILNADSSQKDAIELSHRGVSFVMQGPPGTGKSQTITNIIAQAMGEGKTVLFVSEKQAALDVVYKRLADVGVGDLCLPLHDPKTNKSVVLKQLEKNLDAKKSHVGNAKLAELHELASIKETLNAYATALHEKQMPLEMSIYEAYEMLVSMQEIQPVYYPLMDIEKKSRSDMNRMARECSEYARIRDSLGTQWYTHPWIGVKGNNITNMQKQGLKELMERLFDALEDICRFSIDGDSSIGDIISVSNYEKYLQVARTVASFSIVPPEMVLADNDACETDYPDNICKLIKKVQDVFGKDALLDLFNINNLIDLSKRVKEATSGILKVLSGHSKVTDTVGYFDLLNLAEIMYQYGFSVGEINITDAYFDCSENVKKLIKTRKEQIEKIDELRKKILLVFSEQILYADYDSVIVSKKKEPEKSIRELLKDEYSIEINEIADDESLTQWVKNVLSGCFDVFGRLSENEFYYVYDLLEEANKRSKQLVTSENKEAKDWFRDYGSVIQQYLSIKDINGINWESQLSLANDFYYIKSTMPGLFALISFTEEQKQIVREKIDSSQNSVGYNLEDIIQKYGKASHDKCVTTYDYVQDYHTLVKEIEVDYLSDASILGGSYLMLSTDWNKIENMLLMVSMLRGIFSENMFLGVRELLLNWNGFDVSEYMQNLQAISNCPKIPGCENHSIKEQIDILGDVDESLADLRNSLIKWKEICYAVNRIRSEIYDNSNQTIDVKWLKRILEEDSKFLIDSFNILQKLGTEMESINQYMEFFDDTKRLEELSITSLRSKIENCLNKFSDFDTLVEYQICSAACRNDGIEGFVEVASRAGISLDNMKAAFVKTFLTVWVDSISQLSASVSTFMPQKQERLIETFKKLDQKQLGIAKDRVLESAFGRMPSRSAGKVVGEMGILLRELSKSRNALSIRQLFDKIPKLLLTLKPCLMMSPLSVAYFLKANLYCFDMVIFDEASQIFPENAIGAILRGKQVIISGDNKQMPPTAFFHTALGSQENESDIDDVENGDSILEEAENILPNLSLTWHYRSKNESLITFSNRYMYSGSLVTFPNSSPDDKDYGVEYEYVEGAIYENRQNIEEANRCVELTIRHFIDHPDKSIGIIAFSISQEDAIEQAFNTYRRNHPEYEEYFRDNRPEPFFIKNLENVQGDERDTIILSIGYGLNRQGILRYNFGPLGMQGGERRMNVAITRAKYNIKLVCSLKPDDFDQAKVQEHAGAKLLYDYIRYAMYGVNNISQTVKSDGADEIKKYICQLLTDEGFTVALNIGNSGYKIPIAIEHPRKKGAYILGIETDGEEYVSARTARDREALRPDILKSMGWKLYRVWSTQWNRDIETEKKKLLDFVRREISCAEECNFD